MPSRVILLAGPAGSGKTSTARMIGEQPGWHHASEDAYWDEFHTTHPRGEFRTDAEHAVVQARAVEDIVALVKQGTNVVLEFILYEDPPKPLLKYQEAFASHGIPYMTTILRPSVDAILQRMDARGRENDKDMDRSRANAEHQVKVLHSPHIKDEWVIDSTDLTLEKVVEKALQEPHGD